ncbi:MAG: hypothetical protein JOZ10_16520 [Acidobacteria bacterium]|nr:hypothetical protein [Acidobacteriota bacterium]
MGFSAVTRLALLLAAAAILASCGHKSSTTTSPTPASITTNPTSFSLNHGQVVGFNGTPVVVDSTGTNLATQPTFTYSSSDPTQVTVTSSGTICAGVFDANNIVCQPQPDNGKSPSANILVTGDGLTATIPVFVHPQVDSIVVSGPTTPPVCVSQNQTEQFAAKAFSNGTDVTSKVGPFTWRTGNAVVATVDQNGLVTSRQPGATSVVATIASTTGTPAIIVDCPPKTISLHIASATDTTFKVATGTSQTLAADVTDILGQPISGATLTFSSFIPSAAISSNAGAVTTPGAGTTSIVASCSPPACNPAPGNVNANGTGVGLSIYSNPVVGAITGSTATTVYVTGADNPDGSANKSLIPITISSNTAGTAVTLQGSPNSMVFNRTGSTAYIGSDAGLLIFDPGTNAVTATAAGLTGKVLAVSNDGNSVVISDTTNSKVFLFNPTANSDQEFDVGGVTAADFNSDNTKAYFTTGSTVYEYSLITATFKKLSLSADGVVFTPQDGVAYFGGTSIFALASCNDARVDNAAGTANILGVTADGTHMIGAGANGWVDLAYTVNNSNGCPPSASNTPKTTAGFGSGATFVGTPTQIAVTANASFAFLTGFSLASGTNASGVPFYHFADSSLGVVPLINPDGTAFSGTIFTGSVIQDSTSLFVGVDSNGANGPQVHRLDLTQSSPVDSKQISVTFRPRIVVVRPQ